LRLAISFRPLPALCALLAVFTLATACDDAVEPKPPRISPTLAPATWAAQVCGVVKTLGATLAGNPPRAAEGGGLSLDERKALGKRVTLELIAGLDVAVRALNRLKAPEEARPFHDAVRYQYELLAALLRRQRDAVDAVTATQQLDEFNAQFVASSANMDREIGIAFAALGSEMQGTITSEWQRAGCA